MGASGPKIPVATPDISRISEHVVGGERRNPGTERGKIVLRKLQGALLILSALLDVYSVFAWHILRGAGAYRINTLWGAVLAHTWPYTAAFVLTIVFLLAYRVAYALNVRFRRVAPDPETIADGASQSAGRDRRA